MNGTVLSQFLSICWLTLQGFQFRCKLRAPRIWGIVIIERFFLIFSALVIFLKGFTKEISNWKYRVFAKNCKFFTESYCSHFFIFWGFFILIFALHCYIFVFLKILKKLCFYATYKNGVEPGKSPIFYRIFMKIMKMLIFHIWQLFCMLRKNSKKYEMSKNRYTEIQRKKQN